MSLGRDVRWANGRIIEERVTMQRLNGRTTSLDDLQHPLFGVQHVCTVVDTHTFKVKNRAYVAKVSSVRVPDSKYYIGHAPLDFSNKLIRDKEAHQRLSLKWTTDL